MSHGATVNGVYCYGSSPLRAAVQTADPAIVEKLINCGADVNLKDKKQHTILCEALYCRQKTKALQIVKLLVENGADTKKHRGDVYSLRETAKLYGLKNVVAYFDERGIR